jgi:hypothetical protein
MIISPAPRRIQVPHSSPLGLVGLALLGCLCTPSGQEHQEAPAALAFHCGLPCPEVQGHLHSDRKKAGKSVSSVLLLLLLLLPGDLIFRDISWRRA